MDQAQLTLDYYLRQLVPGRRCATRRLTVRLLRQFSRLPLDSQETIVLKHSTSFCRQHSPQLTWLVQVIMLIYQGLLAIIKVLTLARRSHLSPTLQNGHTWVPK